MMELNIVLSSGRKTHNKAKSKQNIITGIIIPSCFAQDYVKETFFTYHDVTWGKCENKLCRIIKYFINRYDLFDRRHFLENKVFGHEP